VAFESDSDFLGQGIPRDQDEIWLHNTATRVYTRVTNSPGRESWSPSLSADGAKVAIKSDADFLGQGIPQFQFEIWLFSSPEQTIYLPMILKD
jgi:Tol biopolymer transport system component